MGYPMSRSKHLSLLVRPLVRVLAFAPLPLLLFGLGFGLHVPSAAKANLQQLALYALLWYWLWLTVCPLNSLCFASTYHNRYSHHYSNTNSHTFALWPRLERD